jgi:hypothetical protein
MTKSNIAVTRVTQLSDRAVIPAVIEVTVDWVVVGA